MIYFSLLLVFSEMTFASRFAQANGVQLIQAGFNYYYSLDITKLLEYFMVEHCDIHDFYTDWD